MNDMPELTPEQQDNFKMAAELNSRATAELVAMEEEELKHLASEMERMLDENFHPKAAEIAEDEGIEVSSMFLPQTMMDMLTPYMSGILLSEDNLVVVPGSDLPLMCRVDGYISVE